MTTRTCTNVLAGVSFDLEKGPYFIIDCTEKEQAQPITRKIVSIWNRLITLKLLDTRQCIGQYDILTKKDFPCPTKSIVPYGKSSRLNCLACFDAVGFNPSFFKIPKEQLSQKQQEYNLRPHYVYLADFGVGAMKVGTAYEGRYMLRWLDQGARMATILKKCKDAYEARDWEVAISQEFNLPEGITMAHKKVLLNSKYNFEERERAINDLALRITKHFQLDSAVIKVHNFHHLYFQREIPSNLVEIVLDNHLEVKTIGLIGNILIFSYPAGHGMLALSHLFGKAEVSLIEESI